MNISVRKDERGLGHIVLILVVLVLAVVGFAGWRVSQKNDTKDSTTSGTALVSDKAAVDACNKLFKDKDLCKFTGNYAIDKLAFKMTFTSETKDGKSTSAFLSDGKGNTSMTGTAAGQETAFVQLDKVSYMKDNTDGKWFKFGVNDTSAPKETNPTSDVKFDTTTDAVAKNTITYKKLGKEKCGSLNCLKYQVIDTTQPNTTQYFWFDTKDYRMQHYYSKDASSTTDMVIAYQAVTITAPSPTKDFAIGGTDTQALQQALQSLGGAATPTDTTSTQ